MPKTFTYETEGLSYTVVIYEDPETPGSFLADITVDEGAMDVNAVYFGDDDFSGDSASLGGPLNMNGARLDGEKVQWDSADELSSPGLGPEGTDKETYLSTGDTLTISLDIDSLDEVDVFGIRATSTSTPEGSIKGVSDEPEDDVTFDKVGFGVEFNENGVIENGVYVREEDLPEGEEGTFENYVNYYDSTYGNNEVYNITQVESVIFYEITIDGGGNEIPQELFRIDAPEGGFTDAEDMIAAYDEAISNGALDEVNVGSELMAALSYEAEFVEDASEEEDVVEDDLELI
ncbi:hypothetical protein [Aestuariicoccus sp. MJ-SS9]|uniref:hypothetical protein n=1 Tax=Aestuariicoccus sp. MJ-SS9 TaxID=3079855 RepID=UPI00290645AC|nr:hypothetical protein [Aestuariicoccus sp. MJ-SS9]MDU8914213.1 hypothetical protein [Aestuariicoccus sp. MJ-SS9]